MREFTLAGEIVRIALKAAGRGSGGPLRRVHVRIGRSSCVDPGNLTKAFEIASRETEAARATLNVEFGPPRQRCNTCGERFASVDWLGSRCICGSPDVTVENETEMEVTSIDFE